MDKKVEEVLEGLFSKEAYERPCDDVKPENLEMKLPVWFDEKKFNQGRRFQKDFFFMQSISMMLGLISVMAIPTILSVLVGSRRSNSQYTAFKRYWSTYNHIVSWYNYDLKPGSVSWRSLETVRTRHILADRASKLKGHGTVSQRDVAFTLFGFIGFNVLKPDRLSIRALQPGDWEAFNHFWAVIASMIGLEDRYNICRKDYNDTRQICRVLQDKIFTPCLTNTPNYFEHAAYVMASGMSAIYPAIENYSLVYVTKYLSNVPGYIYTEEDRLELQKKLRKNAYDMGVVSSDLIEKCPIDFLPNTPPAVLYLKDYETVDGSPHYKLLPLKAKFLMNTLDIFLSLYTTNIGRIILNLQFYWYVFLGTYLPYVAMWRYGFREAYISLFKENPTDDVKPQPNSKYYNREPKTWYRELWDF